DKAEPKVQLQSAMSQPYRFSQPFAGRQAVLLHSSEIIIMGSEVLRSPSRRHRNLCLKHFWLNGRDNRDRHFVLQSKNVRQVTLKPVCPDVRASHRINQLPCNANLSQRLAHSPLKDVAHPKPAPDFLDIDRSALKGEARIARDHEQRFEPRKRSNDLLNH